LIDGVPFDGLAFNDESVYTLTVYDDYGNIFGDTLDKEGSCKIVLTDSGQRNRVRV
jgi:hypothetical protein